MDMVPESESSRTEIASGECSQMSVVSAEVVNYNTFSRVSIMSLERVPGLKIRNSANNKTINLPIENEVRI